MNERRLRFVFCGFRVIALGLANEPMPLSVERSQGLGKAWHDGGALLIGERAIPAISLHHLAIRSGCICAEVKQKEYRHTLTSHEHARQCIGLAVRCQLVEWLGDSATVRGA